MQRVVLLFSTYEWEFIKKELLSESKCPLKEIRYRDMTEHILYTLTSPVLHPHGVYGFSKIAIHNKRRNLPNQWVTSK